MKLSKEKTLDFTDGTDEAEGRKGLRQLLNKAIFLSAGGDIWAQQQRAPYHLGLYIRDDGWDVF